MMIYKPFLHLIPITNIQENLEICKYFTDNHQEMLQITDHIIFWGIIWSPIITPQAILG